MLRDNQQLVCRTANSIIAKAIFKYSESPIRYHFPKYIKSTISLLHIVSSI